MNGRIEAIFIAPAAGAPLEPREHAEVTAAGIEGDRYAEGSGTFSSWPGDGRALTLIEAEALEAMEAETGVGLTPAEARRNLLTRGVRLANLIGKRFQIGSVVLAGRRPADPCDRLQRMTRPGVLNGLVDRGGLRADVLAEGTLRVGDEVVVLGEAQPRSK